MLLRPGSERAQILLALLSDLGIIHVMLFYRHLKFSQISEQSLGGLAVHSTIRVPTGSLQKAKIGSCESFLKAIAETAGRKRCQESGHLLPVTTGIEENQANKEPLCSR